MAKKTKKTDEKPMNAPAMDLVVDQPVEVVAEVADAEPGPAPEAFAEPAASGADVDTTSVVSPATDVTIEAPAVPELGLPEQPQEVTIDDVLREIHRIPIQNGGYGSRRRPEIKLSESQARTQHRLVEALKQLGRPIRRPGDVYGFLLDEIERAAKRYSE